MQVGFQKENSGLLDIVDLAFLQDFQDKFAKSVNVASIMVDDAGPITKPSNFTDFCIKYTRGSHLGSERCNECDIKWGKLAALKGEPVIYTCHSGLTDFAVPIMLDGKHIASILGGQVLTHKPDEGHFRQIAKELGINEDEYLDALRKIKIIPLEQIEAAAQLMFVVANSISEMAKKNFELIEKNKEEKKAAEQETILRTLIEVARCSFDIKEVKQNIVNELGKAFKADRCYFRAYDKNKDEFLAPEVEYCSSSNIKSLKKVKTSQKALSFFAKELERRKSGFYPIVVDENFAKGTLIEEYMAQFNIKIDYAIPIVNVDKEFIWLVLHYSKEIVELDESYKKLLEIIAYHIDITLNQLKLYNTVKITARNENVLRRIISSSVNNFDIKELITSIITETCQLFGADRCLFIEYKPQNNDNEVLQSYTEYLSSEDVIQASINIPEKITMDALIKSFKNREVLTSNNVAKEKLLKETKQLLDVLSVKSYLVVPVYFGAIDYGAIVLHYVKNYRQFNDEEIDLVRAIANQSAAVIHQAKLYQTIEKNEKYTRTVLNNIKDAIVVVDEEFKITACNPAVEIIWGYSRTECAGKPLSMLLKSDCDEKRNRDWFLDNSVLGIKNDGSKFPIEINSSNIVTENRGDTMLVIRDITERKRIEQMKTEFVSTVSHELRTPLTSLKGSLGLILSGKMGELSEKIKGLLNIANNNCSRLINLINDILDVEKIEAGKMDFDVEVFELMPLIEQSIQLNLQFAKKFNVKINLVKTLNDVFVQVDSSRLIQVITNLLSNAIKFSESGSAVNLSAIQVDGNIRIAVTNYGSEIPQDFKTRIFQKFAQADSSDSRKKGGTGLGLSISKAIIEKLNGNIGFVSENNETTFYFDLPEFIKNNEEN